MEEEEEVFAEEDHFGATASVDVVNSFEEFLLDEGVDEEDEEKKESEEVEDDEKIETDHSWANAVEQEWSEYNTNANQQEDSAEDLITTKRRKTEAFRDENTEYNTQHGYTLIDTTEIDPGTGQIKTVRKLVPLTNDTDIVEEEEDINEEMDVSEIHSTVLINTKDEDGNEVTEEKKIIQEVVKDPTKQKRFMKLKLVNDLGETVEELIELTDDARRTNEIMRLAAPFMKRELKKQMTPIKEGNKDDKSLNERYTEWLMARAHQKEEMKSNVISRLKQAREDQKKLQDMNSYLGKKLCEYYDLRGPIDPTFEYDDRTNSDEAKAKYHKRLLEFNDVINFIFQENKTRATKISQAELDVQNDSETLKREKQKFYDLEESMLVEINPADEAQILRNTTFKELVNQQKTMDISLAKVRLEFIRTQLGLKILQDRKAAHQSAIDRMEKVDFISYQSLKVKTKDLNDKLDLKEKQVLVMKDRLTQRVQALAHVRLKSDHLTTENSRLRKEAKEISDELNAVRKECLQVRIDRRDLEKQLAKVTSKVGLEKYPHLLSDSLNIEAKAAEQSKSYADLVTNCAEMKTLLAEKLEEQKEEIARTRKKKEEIENKMKLFSFDFHGT